MTHKIQSRILSNFGPLAGTEGIARSPEIPAVCPDRVFRCPICREPLAPEDEFRVDPDDCPTHYACRVALQEWEEELGVYDDELPETT